ncbi:hypothetical protein OSCT_1764 [Oscillochloris trichoides DG-6]|uniref:YYY membrane protein n=1 Tax=Oscillochloris trichoides DG-6 TaxID=765420 RepID=E1IEL3_9CHLR|nr:DUF2298 domain-containing protein [Oscillochloris trichoides]EFO80405.1 hypothetical protein OSCT_1764 [Oscillochloris trichoides DG-6]
MPVSAARAWRSALLLLLPLFAVIILWQIAHPVRIDPRHLDNPDISAGFGAAESGAAGDLRWAGASAQIYMPGPSGILVLRGVVAPGAQVDLVLNDSPPLRLAAPAAAPQLRTYQILLAAQPDALGWMGLQVRGNPAAQIEGRELSLALHTLQIMPVRHELRLPPSLIMLLLGSFPLLLALVLSLAGIPRPWAMRSASIVGIGLVGYWASNPGAVYGLLLDIQTFFSTTEIWIWWLWLQLVGWLAWPLTSRIMGPLPLHGYPLAKLIGLLACGWIAWVGSLLGIAAFGPLSLGVAGALVAAAGWIGPRPRLRVGWQGIVAYELLLIGGLFLGIWLRWHGATGPALTGTEKPMEIAILNAIMRDPHFPPLDPWMAGFGLNYYYLGYVILAGIALLSHTPATVAFNLGFGLVVALTVVSVAYVGHALAAHTPGAQRRSTRVGLAGLALLLCLGLGSQSSALQVLIGSPLVRALDGGQLLEAMGQRISGAEVIQLSRATPASWDGPAFSQITPAQTISFDWFGVTRSLYDDIIMPNGAIERRYAITEFPAFSFYLGDLHPHIIAMPFNLLAIGIALALLIGPTSWLRIISYGLVVGALYCINSWDAPSYALLGAGIVVLRLSNFNWQRFMSEGMAMGLGALTAALPFLLTFRPPAGPVEGWVAQVPLINRLAGSFGLATQRTHLHSFVIIFGLFILFALVQLRETRRTTISILVASLLIGSLIGFPLLILLPLALIFGWRAWQQPERSSPAFIQWIAALSSLALLVPELIYIRDHLEGEMSRMITIFKFYFQAWLLLGLVAAYGLWQILRGAYGRRAYLWLLPTGLLLFGGLIYPWGLLHWATPWQASQRSLDGLAWMEQTDPDGLAAARWLATHLGREEVLVSGYCGCKYEEESRIAAISGVQSVLGWMDGHERVWRSGYPAQLAEIAARERDIGAIYRAESRAVAQPLLERYGIDYLYLGPLEREIYGPQAAQYADELAVAFRQGGVTIYRVTEP